MAVSKAWEWNKDNNSIWLNPSEESYYIAHRWKEKKFRDILDFGCGLGRHAICFAKQDFNVKAFDLSIEGKENLIKWSDKENLSIGM